VPPSAVSSRPGLLLSAPVKAPFSWPNSSLSSRDSDSAAQFSRSSGLLARREREWMASAMTSLPDPVSPSSSTLMSLAATRSTSR